MRVAVVHAQRSVGLCLLSRGRYDPHVELLLAAEAERERAAACVDHALPRLVEEHSPAISAVVQPRHCNPVPAPVNICAELTATGFSETARRTGLIRRPVPWRFVWCTEQEVGSP